MSVGTRGKYAEGKVRDMLKLYANYSSFTFMRLPDARAGSLQPTLCDFIAMHLQRLHLIEVKEVEKHSFRLSHNNFSPDKVGRCRAWNMAGAEAHVLVYFVPEKAWRLRPLDYFMNRTGGSWDMSDVPLITLQGAFRDIFGPEPHVI